MLDSEGPSANATSGNGKPTFASTVKARQASIKLWACLFGLIAGLPLAVRPVDERFGIHNPWVSCAIVAIPASLILCYLLQGWLDERNRRRLEAVGRQRRSWTVGSALVVWGISIVCTPFLVGQWQENAAKELLANLHIRFGPDSDGHRAASTYFESFSDSDLERSAASLATLSVQTLQLSRTQVRNLAPLRALTGLQELHLANTEVESLEPLRALTSLQELDLPDTRVENLEPLRALTGLRTLNLAITRVENLEPLRSLTGLQHLNLNNTHVESLEPLRASTGLQTLDLAYTRVEDIEPLRALTGLQRLDLAYTRVENIDSLRTLSGLRRLDLTGTHVQDLGALATLKHLQLER